MSYTIVLPFPPSLNQYYRNITIGGRARTLISESGRRYRDVVNSLVAETKTKRLEGDLAIEIEAWFPDKRKRDLDNTLKATLDSLTHAGVWNDDSQIKDLHIWKAPLIGGMLKISVREI